MSEKVTIHFQGGPMDGEGREFLKGNIPRVVETMEGIGDKDKSKQKIGRYELRYLYLGERLSEEKFGHR